MTKEDEGATQLHAMLREVLSLIRDRRPPSLTVSTMGEALVVALFERATSMGRAVDVLIEAGLADEAAHQVRSLLEVSVILGHAAERGVDLDQLALTVMHESVQQERGELVASVPGVEEWRAKLEDERLEIVQLAAKLGLSLSGGSLNIENLARQIDRQEEVTLAYRRTSSYVHVVRRALGVRMRTKDESGSIVIRAQSSAFTSASMAELAARLLSGAAYSSAWLLGWENVESFKTFASDVDRRIDSIAGRLARQRDDEDHQTTE